MSRHLLGVVSAVQSTAHRHTVMLHAAVGFHAVAPGFARCRHDRLGKRGFAEQHFRISAPDLDLGNIVHLGRQDNGSVLLVALDDKAIQEIDIALGIHHLPMRRRRVRSPRSAVATLQTPLLGGATST